MQSALYALLVSFLFFGFISFLEYKKTKGKNFLPVNRNLLFHQGILAEVANPPGSDDTGRKAARGRQFFKSGGFLQFIDQVMVDTGKWEREDGQEVLRSRLNSEPKVYSLETWRPNELVLSSKEVKIRLSKIKQEEK